MTKKNLSILDISLTSGGAEKVISLLLKELIKDYNVTLFLFYNEIHFDIPKEVNTVIFNKKDPKQPVHLKFFHAIRFLFKYNKMLRKEKIQYAISFLAFPNLVNGILAIFNPSIKMFVSERGFPSDNTTSKLSLYISKVFYPMLYNRCYKLFSNSEYINQDLKKNFGIKIPMEVIYNPIDLPENTIDPKKYQKHTNTLKVINVGSINTRKNQEMIIKALSSLSSNGFNLTILGDGPLKENLKELSEKYNIEDKVELKGKVKNVNEHLVKSDCFVLSSYTEGFPNALLEAIAAGLPSISTNCLSGPLELLNNNEDVDIIQGSFYKAKYGILVNNNDVEGLTKALNYLKENPTELEKYSQLSLIRAKEYELGSIYAKFNQFIIN